MVSIIIPTLNEGKYLPKLLKSLSEQSFQEYEIIIADSASIDDTVEIAKKFGAQITEGGIPSVGRNNGARIAKGEILIFLDGDVELDSDFLQLALKEFRSKKLDIAGAYFKVLSKSIPSMMNFLGNNNGKYIRQYTKYPALTGDFMIMKREVFDNLGGFKEIKIGEDNDIAERALAHNFKFRNLNISYRSSSRRIDKVGLWNITKAFFIFSYAQLLGKSDDPKIQLMLKQTYGDVRGGS